MRELLIEKSEGVLSTLTDGLLWSLFFGLYPSSYSQAAWEKERAANILLSEINYRSLKNSFYNLKRRGLITYLEGKALEPKITEEGKKRLASLVPQYYEKRTWDGRIYLVAYDIPEEKKNDREKLREFLLKIGCGKLQASVYLSLYNPKGTLKEFIKERKLSGWIIVSDIGKDGSVGEKNIKELVVEVYGLEVLNERYKEFIRKFGKAKPEEINPSQAAFSFYSILIDDPQLPFELLPHWWRGNRAHRLFKRMVGGKTLGQLII